MDSIVRNIISACWGVFFIVWVVGALFTKRAVYRESSAQRLRYVILILIGWYLLFRGYGLPSPFSDRVIPAFNATLVLGAVLCVCGLTFCLWARAVLGRNWSGTVTLKENHELIVRGPYRLVRHPIYTGLLTMILGTAIQQGRVAGLLGLILVFISFLIKLSHEEEVMLKQFPEQYPAYAARVRRLIPFIL